MQSLRRRALLLSMVTVGLAGCQSAPSATPVAIPSEARCDRCGMQIHAHPGPSAQVFFADGRPHGREGPAWFDSTWEAYQYVFEHEQEVAGWFVTDYSTVDPAITAAGGAPTIARAVAANSFRAAGAVTYVMDSRVVGAMGRDLIGFGQEEDARSFRRAYGGAVVGHRSVTPELVATLGR